MSDNTKRVLKRKFDQGVKAFSGVLAKTLCPVQSMEELLEEAEKKETEEHSSISGVTSLKLKRKMDQETNEEMDFSFTCSTYFVANL